MIGENKIIGVTGIIGSGKSTVSRRLSELGYFVIDADPVAKELMITNPELVAEIKAEFGENSYLENGELNRPFIADAVFGKPDKLTRLNALVHPHVRHDFARRSEGPKHENIVFWDVPLLIEGGMNSQCDQVILVVADYKIRLKRALALKRFSEADFARRDKEQIPLKEKENLADYIIDNSHDFEHTYAQIESILLEIGKS